jgi:Smg protein
MNAMFEVLVYMFENYIDSQFRPDPQTLSKELCAAGFDEQDIDGAFDWFTQLEVSANQPLQLVTPQDISTRIFTDGELKKITGESIGFILFLVQANILNAPQRELVFELAMDLPLPSITIEEMRWIVLMTTWSARKTGQDKTKDYLFIEDALINKQNLILH